MHPDHAPNVKLFLAVALAACATSIFANSLTVIPTLEGDTSNSGRAITPDGQYVVGLSGSRGFLYPVGSVGAINVISSDGAQSTVATGVGYRTSGGVTELIIAGMSSGYVTEWMTADGGTSFGPKRRNVSFTSNVQPAYNSLGSALGSDAYYVTSWINGNGQSVYLGQATGSWLPTMTYTSKGISSTDSSRMNGVSASGRAVGWRINGGIRKNYMLTWTGTTPGAVFFNGLDGTQAGQAFSVSADGNTIFGQSPLAAGGTDLFGYKVVNPGASQTINPLPLFGDETGSTSLQVPYGSSADGGLAVGMSYRGMEKATLWWTYGAPENWYALDLTSMASAQGLLGDFARLNRAYSVGISPDGNFVVTGEGSLVDGSTRAFVMTVVPEPASLSMFLLGLCGYLVARRRS